MVLVVSAEQMGHLVTCTKAHSLGQKLNNMQNIPRTVGGAKAMLTVERRCEVSENDPITGSVCLSLAQYQTKKLL